MKNFFKFLNEALIGGIVYFCIAVSRDFWVSNSYVWSLIFCVGGFLLMDLKSKYEYTHKIPPFDDEKI